MGNVRVLKFPVSGYGTEQTFRCKRSRLLDIQAQGDQLVCWVETRDEFPESEVALISVGTGWEVPSDVLAGYVYFKTVQDCCGLVWHFYEKRLISCK